MLSPRQWHGMRAWLSEPARFQDPRFDSIAARVAAFDDLGGLIAGLCAESTMDQLVAEGQAHGVPVAAVLTPSDALESEHLREVAALADTELAPGCVPGAGGLLDGRRPPGRLSHAGTATRQQRAAVVRAAIRPRTHRAGGCTPLEGIRVLDLRIIVAGGELSRLFGDLGAEVLRWRAPPIRTACARSARVRPSANPSPGRTVTTSALVWSSVPRTVRPCSSDWSPVSDAVFANFKPGTLAGLGFPYPRLRQLNPALVLAEQRFRGHRPVEWADGVRTAGASQHRCDSAVDLRAGRHGQRPPSVL